MLLWNNSPHVRLVTDIKKKGLKKLAFEVYSINDIYLPANQCVKHLLNMKPSKMFTRNYITIKWAIGPDLVDEEIWLLVNCKPNSNWSARFINTSKKDIMIKKNTHLLTFLFLQIACLNKLKK